MSNCHTLQLCYLQGISKKKRNFFDLSNLCISVYIVRLHIVSANARHASSELDWAGCRGRGKGSSGCQQHKREAGGRAPKINANLYRGKLFNLFFTLFFFLSFFLCCFALLCFTFFLSVFHSSSTTTCSERAVQRPFSPDTPPFRQRPLAPPTPLAP